MVQRLTVFALALGTVLILRKRRALVGNVTLPILTIGGLDVAAAAGFAVATTQGELSIVAVLGALYPVATVVLAYYALRERLSRVQTVGVVCALAAAVILVASRGT